MAFIKSLFNLKHINWSSLSKMFEVKNNVEYENRYVKVLMNLFITAISIIVIIESTDLIQRQIR